MNKLRTSSRYFINALLCAVFLFSCKSEIKDGQITSIGFLPPHEETYQYSTVYMIGEVPMTQWHTGYRWIPDTTYYETFMKIVDKDTIYREIVISKEDAYKYKVGDYIQLKDE